MSDHIHEIHTWKVRGCILNCELSSRLKRQRLAVAAILSVALCSAVGRCSGAANVAESRNPIRSDVPRKAMEVLKAECFGCHNEEKKKGGLILTSRELLLKGNKDGPVVTSGKPDESRLIKALDADADPHMPPKKQLTVRQMTDLRKWIQGGMVWDAKALADNESRVVPVKLATLPPSYQPVMALTLSPNGKRLAVGRGGAIVYTTPRKRTFPS